MNLNVPFRPKLLEILKGYSARDFMPDLIAGVTVGIVALPLAMAKPIPLLPGTWRTPQPISAMNRYLLSLLIICAWHGAGTAQAASPGTVLAWGDNDDGRTTVP